MNIVVVNDSGYIRGGADRIAFESAGALAKGGHRVILFTAFGEADPAVKGDPALEVIRVGSEWIREAQRSAAAAIRGMWNRDAERRMRQVLSKLDPKNTVVHVHLFSSALSASVISAANRLGFAVVLTLHDYFITCPNGAYFVFPKAEICERRALSVSCLTCHCDSRRRSHKIWRVARTVVQNRIAHIPRRISAYVAVSRACADLARRDLPVGSRIELIPNVVSIARRPPVAAERNRAYVFAGRLESYKGPQLMARAAHALGLDAVFCGSGPLEGELRRLCPGAEFTGWVEPAKLEEILGRARAFVFPSVYRETFGMAAAEALARGLPVVASRGTAAEEFVVDGENGLLFEHNSPEDLARQLAKLADDGLVRRLGATAFERYWASPLTLEIHVARLLELYRSLEAVRPETRGPEPRVQTPVVRIST